MKIGADKVSVIHGGRTLFNDVSFQVSDGDKIGLIGKNGAGKTTLLKLLAGLSEPDEGTISRSKEVSISYLPQEMPLPEGRTVFQEATRAYQNLLDLDEKATELNIEISRRTDYESKEYLDLIHRQSDINEEMNRSGWFEISMKVEKVLLGLGFEESDFARNTSEFSGGWRMRIELAKILLKQPDLILLDEPTNHLDIESIQWLESFLVSISVSVVIISHDITFLNKLTNRTIEISNSRIYDYPLPYSKYLERRQEIRDTMMASQKNQQKKIRETEVFISRFRAKNTKAKQVQSRVKMLEKMDIIEVDEEKISSMKIRFPEAPRSGKVSLEVEHLNKKFGDKVIFSDLSFIVGRGEKIAFVGKNGAGKTTLSKIIVGEESHVGKIRYGHEVKPGYYAQDQSATLEGSRSVLEEVERESKDLSQNQVRDLLGAFLFSGDDQFKKVRILSGGEKARLALCKLLLTPVNFLILDEPTNHLDIQSKKILKQALMSFGGAMIIVSHDREFLTGLTNRVFEFTGRGVKQYMGDVNEYLLARRMDHFSSTDSNESEKKKKKAGKIPALKDSAPGEREFQKAEKKIRLQIEKAEIQITELEKKLTEINKKISDSEKYEAGLINEFQDISRELELAMKTWEKYSLELDEISNRNQGK